MELEIQDGIEAAFEADDGDSTQFLLPSEKNSCRLQDTDAPQTSHLEEGL